MANDLNGMSPGTMTKDELRNQLAAVTKRADKAEAERDDAVVLMRIAHMWADFHEDERDAQRELMRDSAAVHRSKMQKLDVDSGEWIMLNGLIKRLEKEAGDE